MAHLAGESSQKAHIPLNPAQVLSEKIEEFFTERKLFSFGFFALGDLKAKGISLCGLEIEENKLDEALDCECRSLVIRDAQTRLEQHRTMLKMGKVMVSPAVEGSDAKRVSISADDKSKYEGILDGIFDDFCEDISNMEGIVADDNKANILSEVLYNLQKLLNEVSLLLPRSNTDPTELPEGYIAVEREVPIGAILPGLANDGGYTGIQVDQDSLSFRKAMKKLKRLNETLEDFIQDPYSFLAHRFREKIDDKLQEYAATQLDICVASRMSTEVASSAQKNSLSRRERRIQIIKAAVAETSITGAQQPKKNRSNSDKSDAEDTSANTSESRKNLPKPIEEINIDLEWLDGQRTMNLRAIEHAGKRVYVGYAIQPNLVSISEAVRRDAAGKKGEVNPCDTGINKVAEGICSGLMPWTGLNVTTLRESTHRDGIDGIWCKRISAKSKPRIYFTLKTLRELDPSLESHPEANSICVVVLAEANKTPKQRVTISKLSNMGQSYIHSALRG